MSQIFTSLWVLVIFLILGIKALKYGHREEQRIFVLSGWILIGLGCFVWLLLFCIGVSSLYVENSWFSHLGYGSRFWKVIYTRWLLFLILGIIAAAFSGANAFIAKKFSETLSSSSMRGKIANLPILGFVIVTFFIMGGWAMSQWNPWLLYRNQSPFFATDPLFTKDIGFYLFSLPIYHFASWWLRILFMLGIVSAVGIYLVSYLTSGEVNQDRWTLLKKGIVHISILWISLIVVSLWRSGLRIFDLVYSERGAVFGAGYTDVHAQIGAYKFYMGFLCLIILAIIINMFLRNRRMFLATLGGWIFGFVLIVWIYPALVQYFKVKPNELSLEAEYIQYNIRGTRAAFGLDNVEESTSVTKLATLQDLEQNTNILKNIRLWDWRALHDTYRQIQEIRLYYEFDDVDIDRYWIDGQYRQVMLAAREISKNQLPQKARTWVNEKLKYTHGYGVCLNTVNEFTSEGMPNLLVKDIPPTSVYPELKITRPEIYYGELTNDYVFVLTGEDEFDYPLGEENVYSQYEGSGGINLGSGFRRLAFVLKFGSLKIILSKDLKSQSRIMFRRQIHERVKTIAPFLRYDSDPYIVIGESGKLWWMLDAYTTSNDYPYSERYGDGINYIRNSVKVTIDPYNGNVDFYIWDENDPIIKTYQKIFPEIFKEKSQIPDGLQQHVRYPDDLMTIQARVYGTYHMNDTQVFYNREDQWALPDELYFDRKQPMIPYYVITKLPQETNEEFISMIPLTPKRKQNMIAWMCARIDGDKYGELIVYKLPKGEIILGPEQIEARIDQDKEISAQLTLWNQLGSRVIRGNLLVIPKGEYATRNTQHALPFVLWRFSNQLE